MNNDLISREWIRKEVEEYRLKQAYDAEDEMRNTMVDWIEDDVDNAPPVEPEITEKQAILLLINSGWLVNHDKELREKWERPQVELANEVLELYEKYQSHLATNVIEFGDELKDLLSKYQKGGEKE